MADGDTLGRARESGMDAGEYFRASDGYNYFARLNDAVVTGPTGNNLQYKRCCWRSDGGIVARCFVATTDAFLVGLNAEILRRPSAALRMTTLIKSKARVALFAPPSLYF